MGGARSSSGRRARRRLSAASTGAAPTRSSGRWSVARTMPSAGTSPRSARSRNAVACAKDRGASTGGRTVPRHRSRDPFGQTVAPAGSGRVRDHDDGVGVSFDDQDVRRCHRQRRSRRVAGLRDDGRSDPLGDVPPRVVGQCLQPRRRCDGHSVDQGLSQLGTQDLVVAAAGDSRTGVALGAGSGQFVDVHEDALGEYDQLLRADPIRQRGVRHVLPGHSRTGAVRGQERVQAAALFVLPRPDPLIELRRPALERRLVGAEQFEHPLQGDLDPAAHGGSDLLLQRPAVGRDLARDRQNGGIDGRRQRWSQRFGQAGRKPRPGHS